DFKAALTPTFVPSVYHRSPDPLIKLASGNSSLTALAVPSVEPSSTTHTSTSRPDESSRARLLRHWSVTILRLKTGVTTAMRTESPLIYLQIITPRRFRPTKAVLVDLCLQD